MDKDQLKKSLNLPKTSFPMKANLAQNEPQRLKKWEQTSLYETQLNTNKNSFRFHDGPPYANGHIHVGHLLNKCLKDMVVRSQKLLGRNCPFTPGWDCHGLPIEHRVLSELSKEKQEKLASLDDTIRRLAIRKECATYAEKFIKIQKEEMKRLLTQADYKAPYLTMDPNYEHKTMELFAKLMEEGIVYKQLKPVHWSLANQTALADAELEYQDKIDTSVYVFFTLKNPESLASKLGIDTVKRLSLMIWTTTPWTLPANLAVSLHEDYDYALVEIAADHIAIVAKERLSAIAEAKGIDSPKVLATCKGKDLLGLSYQHPFCERDGDVLHADYVTLEDGTGLVHTAPGHGEEDYQSGLKANLEIYCPVLANGVYDDTVPDWLVGHHIWKANPKIVTHLEENGDLFYSHDFSHSYPHDWRSKTPVIFRSTEQWFISVDNPLKSNGKSLREMALSSIQNEIKFVPEWGEDRLRGMLDSRPDWCISRQRSWGLPIPAFVQKDGSPFMTAASVRAISLKLKEKGSNIWFQENPEELLSSYDPKQDPEAPDGLVISELSKGQDIFDVWFESGASWSAVMGTEDDSELIDLYLEGSDQHRGWFQLSLLLSLAVLKKPAFKTVLTHGFMVDKDGKKMSKSGGNALTVESLLKQYGADVCRWWVSSLSYENDIKVDTSFFDIAGDAYRKIRNTLRFLLSNLDGYEAHPFSQESLDEACKNMDKQSPEAYILAKAKELTTTCLNGYETFRFKEVHQALYQFCNSDLSSFYCSLVKDRLYCDQKNSPRRQRAQLCLHILLEILLRLLSPILPHTSDEAFQSLYPDQSIHLTDMLEIKIDYDANWDQVMAKRPDILKVLEDAKEKGIENSLDCGLILGNGDNQFAINTEDLADLFGVSNIELVDGKEIQIEDRREKPRCERSWKRDPSVKEREAGIYLSDRDYNAMVAFEG